MSSDHLETLTAQVEKLIQLGKYEEAMQIDPGNTEVLR